MTPGIKPLVAGNWKMNGLTGALAEIDKLRDAYKPKVQKNFDMLMCVPFTLLSRAGEAVSRSPFEIGAQDCSSHAAGAHTGDISVEMIADCNANTVIVGHSERRTDHKETDAQIREKAVAALDWGMMAVICIGETEAERKTGNTLEVLKTQLDGSLPESALNGEMVIAYEPVWAIGTGLTPTNDDVEQAHKFMREYLVARFGDAGQKVRLLYGGSVKPSNASELMNIANVDGALVGGASLKAADFLGICAAYLDG